MAEAIDIYLNHQSSSISERLLYKSNSNLQPVVIGDNNVFSPLVSDENRVGNHRNP